MNARTIGMLALTSVVIAGCSNLPRNVAHTDATSALGIAPTYNYLEPGSSNYFRKALVDANNDLLDERRRTIVRNRIIDDLKNLIDSDFYRFTERLREDKAVIDTAVSWFTTAINTYGTVASGGTSKIMSAIAAGATSANETLNANAWGQRAPVLLINTMEAERATIEAKIVKGMATSENAYTVETALSDLTRYYKVGTVTAALSKLEADAANEKTDNEKTRNTTVDRVRPTIEGNINALPN